MTVKYKFEKDENDVLMVRSSDNKGTVVSSKGFYYSKQMATLALTLRDNKEARRYLIMGGGIGWMAANLAAQSIAADPFSTPAQVVSVELNEDMVKHTPDFSHLGVQTIRSDAINYMLFSEATDMFYSSILVDMFLTDEKMVRPNYFSLDEMKRQSNRLLFNIITRSDLMYILNWAKSRNHTTYVIGEVFGASSDDLVKNMRFSYGNKIVAIGEIHNPYSKLDGEFVEIKWDKNQIAVRVPRDAFVYPLDYTKIEGVLLSRENIEIKEGDK
jgi:hypothetical protein